MNLRSPRRSPMPGGRDLQIPPEYSDGIGILQKHRKRHFYEFLKSYAKLNLPGDLFNNLFPMSMTGEKLKTATATVINDNSVFSLYPTFTISYIAYAFTVDNAPYENFDKLTRFLLKFIEKQRKIPTSLLAITLPFAYSKLQACQTHCLRITDAFLESFGFEHTIPLIIQYLTQIDSSTANDIFGNYFAKKILPEKYIDYLIITCDQKNIESRNPYSWKKLQQTLQASKGTIAQTPFRTDIPKPFDDLKETPKTPTQRSIVTPTAVNSILKLNNITPNSLYNTPKRTPHFGKRIVETPTKNESSAASFSSSTESIIIDPQDSITGPRKISDVMLSPNAKRSSDSFELRTPKKPLPTVDDVNQMILELGKHPTDQQIIEVKDAIIQCKKAPTVDLVNLFISAMRTLRRPSMEKHVYQLMTQLHTVIEPEEMLNIYLTARNVRSILSSADQVYQLFRVLNSHQLPNAPMTLQEGMDLKLNPDIVYNFELLSSWETVYKGCRGIYDALVDDPDLDLEAYSDGVRKPFLLYLENSIKEFSKEDGADMKYALDLLDDIIHSQKEDIDQLVKGLNTQMTNVIKSSPLRSPITPKNLRLNI